MVSIQIDFLHIELAIIHRWISTRPTSQQTKILAWPPTAKKNGFSLPTPGYILACFSTCNNVTSISSDLVSVWPNNIHIEVTYIYIYISVPWICKQNCWQKSWSSRRMLIDWQNGSAKVIWARDWWPILRKSAWKRSRSVMESIWLCSRLAEFDFNFSKPTKEIFRPSTVVSPWTGYDRVLSGNASPTGKPSLLPWPLPVLPWCHGDVVTMLPFWRIQSFKLLLQNCQDGIWCGPQHRHLPPAFAPEGGTGGRGWNL